MSIRTSLPILLIVLLFMACKPSNTIPEDLEGKKKYLKKLQSQAQKLKSDIKSLEKSIAALEPPKEKPTVPVSVISASSGMFLKKTELQGNVEAKESAFITSEMGGRIVRLNVEEGRYVRKGQLVGRVDGEMVDKSIDEVNTALALAKEAYDRQKRLWDQEIGSEMQFLQAKNNKERLEKSLATLETQKRKTAIYSPLSGYVEQKFQKVGELAGPGNPIAQVVNTSNLVVRVDVPENMISSVKKGHQVELYFPALDIKKNARITRVGKIISPANRTFNIEIKIANGNGDLKPNLLALVTVVEGKVENAIAIPAEVIQKDISGKNFVYIAKQTGSEKLVEKVYVEIGDSSEGNIVVTGGLTGGEQVIIDGARNVSIGDKLEIVSK